MNLYCWMATVICMIGTAINVKRGDMCFGFWIVGEIMWTLYDIRNRLFSRTILDLIGLVFAVWGAAENWR